MPQLDVRLEDPPMAQFVPSLRVPSDLNRFCLALGLGVAGALFTSKMGMGAGGAYILSLILGTVGFISLGGRYRVFHTGVFGAALVATVLLLSTKGSFGPTGEEVLMHLGISIVLPMTLAQIVSMVAKAAKTPELERAELHKPKAESGPGE